MSEPKPPTLSSRILSWALPEELKEPVLGDLHEEFLQRSNTNPAAANLWFQKQALHCAWQFLWQTQRGVLMFIFSLFVFFGFIIMGMWFGGEVSMYIDVPTALIVFPASITLTIAISTWQSFKDAFFVLLNLPAIEDEKLLMRSSGVFNSLGNLTMAMGLLTTVLGFIAIGSNLDDLKYLGVALAVAFLSLFYGGIVKILCYVAEKKINFRQLELS